MAVKSLITDPATEKQANVVDVNGYKGLVVGTESLKKHENKILFFTDTAGNADMNINAGAQTGSILMYEEDVEWTTTVVAGPEARWNFLDTAQNHTPTGSVSIDCRASRPGNTFELGSDFNCDGHISFTGWAYVTGWDEGTAFNIYAWETTTPGIEGNTVNLADYIDTGVQNSWQKFTIPFDDMGLSTQQINGVRFEQTDRGNNFYLDDIHVNVSGAGALPTPYSIEPSKETWLHVNEFTISFAAPYTGITDVADASENATFPKIPYSGLLGVSLTNGIGYSREQNGEILFSQNIAGPLDLLQLPGTEVTAHGGDGTNSWVTIRAKHQEPIILKAENADKLTWTIQDDLTGLHKLRISAGCGEEQRKLGGKEYETHI